jgi:hypothetical protein
VLGAVSWPDRVCGLTCGGLVCDAAGNVAATSAATAIPLKSVFMSFLILRSSCCDVVFGRIWQIAYPAPLDNEDDGRNVPEKAKKIKLIACIVPAQVRPVLDRPEAVADEYEGEPDQVRRQSRRHTARASSNEPRSRR